MSVLLPNATLGLRRRVNAAARNAHGERVQAGWSDLVSMFDGRTNEQADGSWALGLDPALWPVRTGDLVVSVDGTTWIVTSADLIQNNYDPVVDWVRVRAARRSAGGTEPGGAWFVARYERGVDDTAVPSEPGVPVVARAGLWTGYGPPPEGDWGAQPGDEYLDLATGAVYRLGGES